jgi:hypothetical protein
MERETTKSQGRVEVTRVAGQLKLIKGKWEGTASDFAIRMDSSMDEESKLHFQSILKLSNEQAKPLKLDVSGAWRLSNNGDYELHAIAVGILMTTWPVEGVGKIELHGETGVSPVGKCFYLGNRWILTCSHIFESNADFSIAKVILKNSYGGDERFGISYGFAPLLTVNSDDLDHAYQDVMLIRLDCPENISLQSVVSGPNSMDPNRLWFISDEGCNSSVQFLSYKPYPLGNVWEMKSDGFYHGQSGSAVTDVVGTVGSIAVQLRGNMGYALEFPFTNFLDCVNIVMTCTGPAEKESLLAQYQLQFFDTSSDGFHFLSESPYRIKFDSFHRIKSWWTNTVALDRTMCGCGVIKTCNLDTYLLAFTGSTAGKKEEFLIVHVHPPNEQRPLSFNFACEVNGFVRDSFTSGDTLALLATNFMNWLQYEEKSNRKPYVTYKDSSWQLSKGQGKTDEVLKKIFGRILQEYESFAAEVAGMKANEASVKSGPSGNSSSASTS